MKALVVGYYNHYNLGDEQYKWSIHHILTHLPTLQPVSVEFLDCDKLANHDVPENTVVLLGGGDVLNTYFLDKINKKFAHLDSRPKIIAFSVGIPYNSIFLQPENLKKLEIFDHIYLRTRQDIPLFSEFFDPAKLSYLPDASCFLPDVFASPTPSSYFSTTSAPRSVPSKNDMYKKLYSALYSLHKTKKIINVNLCRHIYHRDPLAEQNYRSIVREMARFLEELTKLGYYLVLLPFNTKPTAEGASDDTNCENDILIHRDVLGHIKNHSNVLNIDYELTLGETLSLYPFFYMSLPMRFHGTLFSINAAVPMVPIYTTKKIKNILLDIGWKHEYVFEKNEKDLPTSFNSKKMMTLFQECARQHTRGKILLKSQLENFKRYYKDSNEEISQVIFSRTKVSLTMDVIPPPPPPESTLYDSYYSPLSLNRPEKVRFSENPLYSKNLESTEGELITAIYDKLQAFSAEHQIQDFRDITDPTLKNIAVCVVSYFLTGQIDSQYNHGLSEKMFSPTYKYQSEWKWVLNHYKINGRAPVPLPDNPTGKFNIGYIDQNDQSGAHRSGWKHVFEHLAPLNNSQAPTLLDLYVDRTFHWKREIYKQIGIIPYRKPWMGFVHHTFDESFSDYSNKALLNCPEFLESLRTCKGIIVLSYYLKSRFDEEFQLRDIDVPVYIQTHPTELEVPHFDMRAFLTNPDKKLVHIGGWLRNIFSFYQLDLNPNLVLLKSDYLKAPSKGKLCLSRIRDLVRKPPIPEQHRIRKVALKGKFMDNYYPPKDFIKKFSSALALVEEPDNDESKFCSQTSVHNNWTKHMLEYLDGIQKRLEIMSTVDNTAYDELLTKNLVFLNLVDGSAVNTLIECMVRNTPVFVNRHPAAVEILGVDYPLYYDKPADVNRLLENAGCIKQAHEYLSTLGKRSYDIDEFIRSLNGLL
jgi:hypothetical protein